MAKKIEDLETKYAQAVDDRGWSRIFDWTPGAWQTHHPYEKKDSVLTHPTVFACQTLIANDMAKLPFYVQKLVDDIWTIDPEHQYAGLLRRPNAYQTRQQFIEYWALSKLSTGNAYGLKQWTGRRITGVDILDPFKVTPLVSDSGEVFYRIDEDQLTPFNEGQIVVPATEIIHDRFNCLYHPLVGTSPIFAAGSVALGGLSGIKNMEKFLKNGSNASGILTAPGAISDNTAKRLSDDWNSKFNGDNSGRVAVAGDGLKFEQLRMSNVDAQLIETLKWDDEKIAAVYHVPGYMVGIGATPSYNNVEALLQTYYSQCLQTLIEALEGVMDRGLDMDDKHRTQLGTEALFRMDTKTQLESIKIGVDSGVYAPNEGRAKMNLKPVRGGESPYLQQQNYSLAALAQRDSENPLGAPAVPEPTPAPVPDPEDDEDELEDMQNALDLFDILVKNEAN
jgi:HK97 family phage portal protein